MTTKSDDLNDKVENKKNSDIIKFIFQICTAIITSCCLPLIAWALLSTVNLKVDVATEKAIRDTEAKNTQKSIDDYRSDIIKMVTTNDIENNQKHMQMMDAMEKQIQLAKLDWEKRMSDYKVENDRRFQEIQRQLEQVNAKLDKALDMLIKAPK